MNEKLTTSQKGEIAKLKVEQRAHEKGWIPSRTVDYARYDLVLDDGQRLYRVQVKYTDSRNTRADGSVSVNLKKEKFNGTTNYQTYSSDEVDVLIVYVQKTDCLCWFGPEHFHNKTSLFLRYEPSKNGQIKRTKMIEDFKW